MGARPASTAPPRRAWRRRRCTSSSTGASSTSTPRSRQYWPEFEQAGKGGVLVRHVLTHSVGMHRIRPIIDHADWMLDWDRMVGVLAAAPPAYPAGTVNGYHAVTYGWLVGEIIRRVDGRPIEQFVADEIARPLDLDGLYLGCPPPERHRIAPVGGTSASRLTAGPPLARRLQKRMGARMGEAITVSRAPFDPRRRGGCPPWCRGPSTRSSAARRCSMPSSPPPTATSRRGRWPGCTRCSAGAGPATASASCRPRPSPGWASSSRCAANLVLGFRMRWRLGYHLVSTTRGVLDPAFGHFGYGGSGAWCDPSRDLAVGFTCTVGERHPHRRHPHLVRVGRHALGQPAPLTHLSTARTDRFPRDLGTQNRRVSSPGTSASVSSASRGRVPPWSAPHRTVGRCLDAQRARAAPAAGRRGRWRSSPGTRSSARRAGRTSRPAARPSPS